MGPKSREAACAKTVEPNPVERSVPAGADPENLKIAVLKHP
jgi:hypothetical protein